MSTSEERSSGVGLWLEAIRPRTLPASVVPVLVGTAVAVAAGGGRVDVAVLAMAASMLLQIGTNLINDYGDHVLGADGPDRLGPRRMAQSGAMTAKTVGLAGLGALVLAAMFGLGLIWIGGWPILIIGIASILTAIAYTAGPFPLAYHGLGEVFVFIFFGPVAVMGTEFVHRGVTTTGGACAATSIGLLAAAILLVNNVRDVDGDTTAGKRTVVVRFGRMFGRRAYTGAVAVAFAIVVVAALTGALPMGAVLAVASAPLARGPMHAVWHETDGPPLNEALAGTAKLELAFGILLSAGLVLGTLG